MTEGAPPDQPFVMVPLGPRVDADGRWCCGLNCGTPCPYGVKLKPGWKR
jgi:hypothetical protein